MTVAFQQQKSSHVTMFQDLRSFENVVTLNVNQTIHVYDVEICVDAK